MHWSARAVCHVHLCCTACKTDRVMVLYCILSVPGVSCRLSLPLMALSQAWPETQNSAPLCSRAILLPPRALSGRSARERDANLHWCKNQSVLAVFVVLIWPRARAVNVTARRAKLKSTNGHEASGRLHVLRGACMFCR